MIAVWIGESPLGLECVVGVFTLDTFFLVPGFAAEERQDFATGRPA